MSVRFTYSIDSSSLGGITDQILEIITKAEKEYTNSNNFQDALNIALQKRSDGSEPLSYRELQAISKELKLPTYNDLRQTRTKQQLESRRTLLEATKQAMDIQKQLEVTTEEAEKVEKANEASHQRRQNERRISIREAETVIEKLKLYSQRAVSTISAISGALSFIYAISGNAEDRLISTLLSVVSSTATLASAYFAIGIATNNWLLLASAGSLLSSTATIINSINSYYDYEASQRQADQTRIAQLQSA